MAGFNIKHWFADGAFRTIIRNSAWLGSSNVVSALLGLLALSCAGKGMTPAMFGVLVIVQSGLRYAQNGRLILIYFADFA